MGVSDASGVQSGSGSGVIARVAVGPFGVGIPVSVAVGVSVKNCPSVGEGPGDAVKDGIRVEFVFTPGISIVAVAVSVGDGAGVSLSDPAAGTGLDGPLGTKPAPSVDVSTVGKGVRVIVGGAIAVSNGSTELERAAGGALNTMP